MQPLKEHPTLFRWFILFEKSPIGELIFFKYKLLCSFLGLQPCGSLFRTQIRKRDVTFHAVSVTAEKNFLKDFSVKIMQMAKITVTPRHVLITKTLFSLWLNTLCQ